MVLTVSVKRQQLFSWGLSLEHIDSEQRMGASSAKQNKGSSLLWRPGEKARLPPVRDSRTLVGAVGSRAKSQPAHGGHSEWGGPMELAVSTQSSMELLGAGQISPSHSGHSEICASLDKDFPEPC